MNQYLFFDLICKAVDSQSLNLCFQSSMIIGSALWFLSFFLLDLLFLLNQEWFYLIGL